jgi:hypothetical protein
MHSWRLAREGIEEARAELNPKLLRSTNRTMARALLLASVSQAATLTAAEYWRAVPEELRHRSPAESAADRRAAAEPGASATKVAPGPYELNALLDEFPLATPLEIQDYSIPFGPDVDAA